MDWNHYDSSGALKSTRIQDLIEIGSTEPTDTGKMWVDTTGIANSGLVTVLPADPYNGQVVYFQNAAMAAKGVVWPLRYNDNGGSPDTYPWEAVGPSPWREVYNAEIVVNGSAVQANSPEIDAPLAGVYSSSFGSANNYGSFTSGARTVNVGLAVNGSKVTDSEVFTYHSSTGQRRSTVYPYFEFTVSTAGHTIANWYDSGGVNNTRFDHNFLSVKPIKVAAA